MFINLSLFIMDFLAVLGLDFLLFKVYYLTFKVSLINNIREIYISLFQITNFLITKEGDIFDR